MSHASLPPELYETDQKRWRNSEANPSDQSDPPASAFLNSQVVHEDRMSENKLHRTGSSSSSSSSASPNDEVSNGATEGRAVRMDAEGSPSEPPSSLDSASQDAPSSQKMYWNALDTTASGLDSINPQSSVKPENWATQTSGSSSSTSIPVASTVAPASNGPPALRPYMSSAAGTPNSSSHHATYTPCSSNSSGVYEGSTLPLTKKEMVPLTSTDNGGSYLAPTNAAEVPGDLALLGVSQANDSQPSVPSSDRLQYAYPPNTSDSSINSQTIAGTMWSAQSTSRPTDYYPSQAPAKSSVRFDRIDTRGNFYLQENIPQGPEDLAETVEEILELEGSLSPEDEELTEDFVDFGNGIKVSTSSDTFDGINFPQLFAASNDHSEKLIDLARQFYPKLRDLIRGNTQIDVGMASGIEVGYMSSDNGSGSDGVGFPTFGYESTMDSVLCKLTSMLEECLFHMVDWVNRTEIFSIIRVEDKMQLLNSSWSEVIVIEFLQCVILNLRYDDRLGPSSPSSPSNGELYQFITILMDYLLTEIDDNQRIRDLLTRFDSLNLSSHEFTCLKFLAIFNCFKHDVHLTSSLKYVQQVQAELCHFLLRAARRTIRRQAHIPPLPDFLSFSPAVLTSSTMLATIAASERLSLLISRLTEVKHVAFLLESFLVGRYYACCIPNESLLTEMLLTKRGARNRVPSQQPPVGYEYNYVSPPTQATLKRDPNVYNPLPTSTPLAATPWRPLSAGGVAASGGSGGGDTAPFSAGTPQYYPPAHPPHQPTSDFPTSQAPAQAQDQSFFMTQNNELEKKSLKKKLFRLVRKGRVERLRRLVNQSFACGDGVSGISVNTATVYLLASVVDSSGRRLLHIACERGHLRMVRYLVDLGLPIETCDQKGNSPVHSCIKYGLKRKRFSKCCKLLACLIESNLELLYVRNNAGKAPSYLLEQLWQESTPQERSKGDALDKVQ
ncbi:hypothetical protein Aperf_G00000026874 [Anoplocephala perfoliata]